MTKAIENNPRSSGGFTVLETVIALGLLLLLGGGVIGVGYRDMAARWRARQAAAGALGVLHQAKWLAISQDREYRVSFDRPEPVGAWRACLAQKVVTGWAPVATPLTFPPEVTLISTTGPETKEFNPDGTSSGGSVLLSCRGGIAYRLSLTPATGRVRLYRLG